MRVDVEINMVGVEAFEARIEAIKRQLMELGELAAKVEGAAPPPAPPVNNYFTISSNHEPSRVARDVARALADRYRTPRLPGFYWIHEEADPSGTPFVALFTSDGKWFYGQGRDRPVVAPVILSARLEPPR